MRLLAPKGLPPRRGWFLHRSQGVLFIGSALRIFSPDGNLGQNVLRDWLIKAQANQIFRRNALKGLRTHQAESNQSVGNLEFDSYAGQGLGSLGFALVKANFLHNDLADIELPAKQS